MINETHFDFAEAADRARGMSSAALHGAILDILRTLPFSDRLDREDGGNRGGRYRDETSVLRAEIDRRRREGGSK